MPYTAIANSEIDANSPLLFSLGRKFRDNPEALADGTAPIKYLLPPARCSTGAGMFRPDGAGRVVSTPFLTGVPSIFFSAPSSVWQIPSGWRKLHVELWGAGDTVTAGSGISNREPGCWIEAIIAVTPLTSLTITLGQPTATIGQNSTITGTGVSLLAPGGSSASVPTGHFSFCRSGGKSGGFQYIGQSTDGGRNYGGIGYPIPKLATGGFCKITGVA